MSAFIGAAIGFLWYNSFPAQVFMGDTGSLAIGGIIAVFAILIRKEPANPHSVWDFLCRNSFRDDTGKPFQTDKKENTVRAGECSSWHRFTIIIRRRDSLSPKIVIRFWIVAVMLAVIAVVTLKIR